MPRRIELTDPGAMRALAHPIRLRLLEALDAAGPLTATQAGERIGESPASCSFHLRQLARYGLVEEAGGGKGRERPWRKAYTGLRFTDVHEDTGTALAAAALDRSLREHYLARLPAALESRARYPREWQRVTGSSQVVLHVTPEELAAVEAETLAIWRRFEARTDDPDQRPDGSLPVEVLLFTYPAER